MTDRSAKICLGVPRRRAVVAMILAIASLLSWRSSAAAQSSLDPPPLSDTGLSSPFQRPLSSQRSWQTSPAPTPSAPATQNNGLPPGQVRIAPTMKFVRVVSAAPNCGQNCPEWISAEGQIDVGIAQVFARFIAGLGGRRLPILISSPGGSTSDAMAMGRLIRAQHLIVAVGHSVLSPCSGGAANCSLTPGAPATIGSYCQSACTLVLAGGVERYASGLSPIGVHQIRLGLKEIVMRHYLIQYRIVDGRKEETSRTLTGVDKSVVAPDAKDLAGADSGAANYLREMGVGEPVMNLMLSTPPTSMHQMFHSELATSRLTTMWLPDGFSLFGRDPDGLKGEPIGAAPSSEGAFAFSARWPILGSLDGRNVAIAAQFQYRPGGGAVSTSVKLVDAATGADFQRTVAGSYVFANAKDTPIVWTEPEGAFGATGWISRDVFCRWRGSRRAFLEFAQPSLASNDERRREWLARASLPPSDPTAAALVSGACTGPPDRAL